MPQLVQIVQVAIHVLSKCDGAFKFQTGLASVVPHDDGVVGNAMTNPDQEQSAGDSHTGRYRDAGASLRKVSDSARECFCSVVICNNAAKQRARSTFWPSVDGISSATI